MAETAPMTALTTTGTTLGTTAPCPLPRVVIRFCTQCRWMLRAAYFAQELLSTFSTALGEVALQPSMGGTFVVEIFFSSSSSSSSSTSSGGKTDADPDNLPSGNGDSIIPPTIQSKVLWDRKLDGGFPETKELKRRVRDVIEPGRNLGHVDREYGGAKKPSSSSCVHPEADSSTATAGQTPNEQDAQGTVESQREGDTREQAPSRGTADQGSAITCEDCQ